MRHPPRLTADRLVQAYRAGLFPMGESRDGPELSWYDPDPRGVLPLDAFHLPRRLYRTIRSNRFQVTIDQAFDAVILACAEPAPGREESWINREIAELFRGLHRDPAYGAQAHSVECWLSDPDAGPRLAGGLYGLAIGGAFFGESMFSRSRDASTVALVHLVARLRLGRFALLDTQFITDHLSRFGAVEIGRTTYRRRLRDAVSLDADWIADPPSDTLAAELAVLAAAGGS